MTDYVVFGEYESEWTRIGTYPARNANSAIRLCLETGGLPTRVENTTSFVAVPARSWQPVTVKRETKTTLRFS
jgi:hypothetical protein